MTSLYNNVGDLMLMLSKIPDICAEFKENPTEEAGKKIVEIIENSEKKLLTIRQNVVTIVEEVKEDEVFSVEAFPSNNGYIIKNEWEYHNGKV